MAYFVSFSDNIHEQLAKLYRKDRALYERVQKKVDDLLERPQMGKPMESKLKGSWRIHVGHFVLMYRIHEKEKVVEFYNIEHHDNVYKKFI